MYYCLQKTTRIITKGRKKDLALKPIISIRIYLLLPKFINDDNVIPCKENLLGRD